MSEPQFRLERSYGEPHDSDKLWETTRFDSWADAMQVANRLQIIGPGGWRVREPAQQDETDATNILTRKQVDILQDAIVALDHAAYRANCAGSFDVAADLMNCKRELADAFSTREDD